MNAGELKPERVESVELAPGSLLLRIGLAADFFVYYPHY